MTIIFYMFFLHFIADFLLQSREMGQKKSSQLVFLFKHILVQFLVFFAGLLFVLTPIKAYQIACVNMIFHGVVDWYIWRIYKYRVLFLAKKHVMLKIGEWSEPVIKDPNIIDFGKQFEYWNDAWFYTTIGFDQFLHFSSLILITWLVL